MYLTVGILLSLSVVFKQSSVKGIFFTFLRLDQEEKKVMFNKPILKLFLTVHNFSGRAKILNSIFKKNEPVLKINVGGTWYCLTTSIQLYKVDSTTPADIGGFLQLCKPGAACCSIHIQLQII